MNNNINNWLKNITRPAQYWIKITALIKVFSGIVTIWQLHIISNICYSAFIKGTDPNKFRLSFFTLLMIMIVNSLLNWAKEITCTIGSTKAKEELRLALLKQVNNIEMQEVIQLSTGKIISTILDQVEGIDNFISSYLPQVIVSAILPIIILILVLLQNKICGLILLFSLPLMLLLMMLIGMGTEDKNQKNFKILARMNLGFLDTLKGLVTLKLFNCEKIHIKKIFNYSEQYRIKTMEILKIAFLSSAILEFFSSISIACIAIYLGMGFINSQQHFSSIWWSIDNINLQQGLFILFLTTEFFLPLRELNTCYHGKAEAVGAAREIKKVMDVRNECRKKTYEYTDKIKLIKFNNLSFNYLNKQETTINKINFEIKEKQNIVIVGPSGAGKTTMLNIILKFLISTDNRSIMVNNTVSLNEISTNSWLKKISYVGQNTKLSKGTIRSNLCFAKNDATDKELWKSLEVTSLKNEVKRFPKQLDTEIREYNIGISSGQIQRLAMSRAYLKENHEIIILDEPTANLDDTNQKVLLESINEIWKEKIVIMTMHNLKYISNISKIIVINNGKIEQTGTMTSLLANKSGLFNDLYNKATNLS